MVHDIKLSATDTNWRLFMVRKADPAFLTFQSKVIERDHHTCQFCGFRTKQSLDVVNLDGNYRHNRSSNLVAACSFCAQCFFLEATGKGDFGGGVLIYLPEMTQCELNALCHVLFATMVIGSSDVSQARNVYRSFKLRSQMIEKELGSGLSNPALLGRLLIDAKVESLEAFNTNFAPKLRLLPDLNRFAFQVASWSQSAMDELTF